METASESQVAEFGAKCSRTKEEKKCICTFWANLFRRQRPLQWHLFLKLVLKYLLNVSCSVASGLANVSSLAQQLTV